MGLIIQETTSTGIVSEALNSIYDIYKDEEYDYDIPVFYRGGYLQRLKDSASMIRTKARAVDRRKFRQLRERADEALQNLRLFVSYKEGEYKKRGL